MKAVLASIVALALVVPVAAATSAATAAPSDAAAELASVASVQTSGFSVTALSTGAAAASSLPLRTGVVLASSTTASSNTPSISKFSPTSGSLNGGTRVTVTGTKLSKVTKVTVGGVKATNLKIDSSKKLRFTTPPASAGKAKIVLYSGSSKKTAGTYLYAKAVPTVTGLTVTRKANNSVSLSWRNPATIEGYSVKVRRAEGTTAPKTVRDGSAVKTGSSALTSVTDAGLGSGKTYSYSVFVVSADDRVSAVKKTTAKTAVRTNILRTGDILTAEKKITSANGRFTLTLQSNGNLAARVGGSSRSYWASNTGSYSGGRLKLTDSGDVVVYSKTGSPVWKAGTSGKSNVALVLGNDGRVRVTYSGGELVLAGVVDTLLPKEQLGKNDALSSANGSYQLVMQSDGKLVLKRGTSTVWTSKAREGDYAAMLSNGNFRVYDGSKAVWSTGTKEDGSYLKVRNDGNVVIYRTNGKVAWDRYSGTNAAGLIGDDYPSKLKKAATTTVVDEWLFYNRNCTSFAAWRLNSANGVDFDNNYKSPDRRWGNAKTWGTTAKKAGIKVDNVPRVGSIAWRDTGTYGHVAWVAKVNGDGTIVIEEYNTSVKGGYSTSTQWSDAYTGFIHVKDLV